MGKGGKGKGGKGGGYPWWEHIKKGTGKAGGSDQHDDGPKLKQMKRSGPETELEQHLKGLEGKSYPAYKDLIGEWQCGDLSIFIDRVQSDPYAPPSSLRAHVSMSAAGFPSEFLQPRVRNTALCDFLTRVFADVISGGSGTDWTQAVTGGGGWSSSKGGNIQVDSPSQFVLPRTSVVACEAYVEVRLQLSLPAQGRSIEGYRAAEIVGFGLIPAVKQALFHKALDHESLWAHIQCAEDQESCRSQLAGMGLVGFVANGAVLPRKSGVDDRPMTVEDDANVVSFQSPKNLQVSMVLPHRGVIQGMGIQKGITLIIGGGFHGKSTLLQALQVGIYNKVPGDGREFVVFDPNGVKVRAEDGRFVASTDVSPFINNLPFEKDTRRFSTKDASGSTSQAANIVEALEMGATSLLVDEDTCATNFMIRDARMQAMVAPDCEPITAFIQKVQPLFRDRGVSTVMVIGGSGDFFEVATTVIQMERYAAKDVTAAAKRVVKEMPSATGIATKDLTFGVTLQRRPQPSGLAADGKVSAKSLRCISYGETEVELTNVEQLVEISQAKALADCLQKLGDPGWVDGKATLREVVEKLHAMLETPGNKSGLGGLDTLSRWNHPNGFYALPRKFEIAAALSRLRTVRMKSTESGAQSIAPGEKVEVYWPDDDTWLPAKLAKLQDDGTVVVV
eukprot:TRINITY_DN108558_c0_g1_i1.p1 TRINITY_DN108558_c0_g1~~TRINITY_DN108558_c0_g1_i1.p1  ORF type:complete len:686 (-),score=120.61 TRINITY_DN108558_c0_g1_i1:127-2154(-)